MFYLFSHNASSKSHEHKLTCLVCAPSTSPAPHPHCTSSIQYIFWCNLVDISAIIASVDPLNFLFSEILSFPQLDSRRMPWGRKFWQGNLYLSNNLEQAKPWFQLIKQKSVKMIGSSFLGIKFVMLDLTTCIIKNCS